jgi:hypothetical protein
MAIVPLVDPNKVLRHFDRDHSNTTLPRLRGQQLRLLDNLRQVSVYKLLPDLSEWGKQSLYEKAQRLL